MNEAEVLGLTDRIPLHALLARYPRRPGAPMLRAILVADDWRVVRITWRQLRDDAPALLADLRRLLRQ